MVADALTKLSACCDCMEDEEEPLLKTAEERRSERDVLVVAFLGTMDDLVVYFSVAVSGKIPGIDLIIGTTLGAVALALCVGTLLEFSERASACVQKVPIPVVLVALACYIIVDAFPAYVVAHDFRRDVETLAKISDPAERKAFIRAIDLDRASA